MSKECVDLQGVGRFHIGLLALCAGVLVLDAFDTQAIGYVAPAIIRDWGVDRLGSVAGPVIGGVLLARHLDLRSIFLLSALPALGAAPAILVMRHGARPAATTPSPSVEEVP